MLGITYHSGIKAYHFETINGLAGLVVPRQDLVATALTVLMTQNHRCHLGVGGFLWGFGMSVEQVVDGSVQRDLEAGQTPELLFRGKCVVLPWEEKMVDVLPPRGSHCPSPSALLALRWALLAGCEQ